MKPYSFVVLPTLIIGVFASWGWYYATKPEPLPTRFMIRPAPRGPRTLNLRAATTRERTLAIRSVVAQLEAFKRDDYEAAAKYQSTGLRRNFSSIENFRSVIQNNYPQFAFYQKANFGRAHAAQDGRLVLIPITLIGQDGVVVRAEYSMVLENGIYRVAGVNGGASDIPGPAIPEVPQGMDDIAPLVI